MRPYFSIIIPTLNEEKFLPRLLFDLDRQNFKNFEVFISDAESTDKTVLYAQKFTGPPLEVVSHKEKNVSAQRNLGARKSKGEFLIFFDADARIPKTFLQKVHRYIEKHTGLLFTTHLSCKSYSTRQIMLTEAVNFIIDLFNRLGKPFAPGSNIIIDRNLFQKLKGFDETLKLAEDHDLVQRARETGVLLKIIKNTSLYISFRRPDKMGYMRVLYQYVLSGAYTILGEPIRKDLYNYPMGGHLYQNKAERETSNYLHSLFKLIKNRITALSKHIDLPF